MIQDLTFNKNLLLAIPKKGRLHERCVKLLETIGLTYKKHSRSDIAQCCSLPITLVFLNVVDIPMFVSKGNVDAGIVGQDILAESGLHIPDQTPLGFGNCSLSLQTPASLKLAPERLIGKRIVTSFPRLARQYFQKLEQKYKKNSITDVHSDRSADLSQNANHHSADPVLPNHIETSTSGTTSNISDNAGEKQFDQNIKTQIYSLSGSVEASIALGLSDGVIDLVESGETMRLAGLEEIEIIYKTEATFICNPQSQYINLLKIIKKRIEGYITAEQYQMISYNSPKHLLSKVIDITPGKTSPTITALAHRNWYAVTAVIHKKNALDIIDQLDTIGAQDILIFDFKHCRFNAHSNYPGFGTDFKLNENPLSQ